MLLSMRRGGDQRHGVALKSRKFYNQSIGRNFSISSGTHNTPVLKIH
jgi:hypothetical protein